MVLEWLVSCGHDDDNGLGESRCGGWPFRRLASRMGGMYIADTHDSRWRSGDCMLADVVCISQQDPTLRILGGDREGVCSVMLMLLMIVRMMTALKPYGYVCSFLRVCAKPQLSKRLCQHTLASRDHHDISFLRNQIMRRLVRPPRRRSPGSNEQGVRHHASHHDMQGRDAGRRVGGLTHSRTNTDNFRHNISIHVQTTPVMMIQLISIYSL